MSLLLQDSVAADENLLFEVDSVKCAVLLWKLKDDKMDQRIVNYKPLFSLPLSQMKPLKQYLPGLTLTMARSFLQRATTDADQKTALVYEIIGCLLNIGNLGIRSHGLFSALTHFRATPGLITERSARFCSWPCTTT